MDIETQKALAEQALAALDERGELMLVDIAVAKLCGWHVKPNGERNVDALFDPQNECCFRFTGWRDALKEWIGSAATDFNAAARLPLPENFVWQLTIRAFSAIAIIGLDGDIYDSRPDRSAFLFRGNNEEQARTGAWLKMVATIGLPEVSEFVFDEKG